MEERLESDAQQLERWHEDSLRILGFTYPERVHLKILIDAGEIDLAEVRRLRERWSPAQVFAYYA